MQHFISNQWGMKRESEKPGDRAVEIDRGREEEGGAGIAGEEEEYKERKAEIRENDRCCANL